MDLVEERGDGAALQRPESLGQPVVQRFDQRIPPRDHITGSVAPVAKAYSWEGTGSVPHMVRRIDIRACVKVCRVLVELTVTPTSYRSFWRPRWASNKWCTVDVRSCLGDACSFEGHAPAPHYWLVGDLLTGRRRIG
ncbi:hypothetical protein A6A27_36635 [Micromonospora sp. CB01531]|nr:hypothetical protein A6A27_36635 [Micromonospora sp. CB01531]